MSRITKDLCERIADKLVEPKLKKARQLQQEFNAKIIKYHQDLIPKEVMEFALKNKEYFKWSDYVYAAQSKFGYNYYYNNPRVSNILISKSNTITFKNSKDENTFEKLYSEYNKQFDNIENLKQEIIISLQALRTYKNIQESFPEAAEYLPTVGTSTALVVNYDKLRAKLK